MVVDADPTCLAIVMATADVRGQRRTALQYCDPCSPSWYSYVLPFVAIMVVLGSGSAWPSPVDPLERSRRAVRMTKEFSYPQHVDRACQVPSHGPQVDA